MILIKMIVFFLSSGFFFNGRFKNNHFIFLLTGFLALISGSLALYSTYEFILSTKKSLSDENIFDDIIKNDKELSELHQANTEMREFEQIRIQKNEKEIAQLDASIEYLKIETDKDKQAPATKLHDLVTLVAERQKKWELKEQLSKEHSRKEKQRISEIKRLRLIQDQQIAKLMVERIKSYEIIVYSQYGQDLLNTAWTELLVDIPEYWTQGVVKYDYRALLLTPEERKLEIDNPFQAGLYHGGRTAMFQKVFNAALKFMYPYDSFAYSIGYFFGAIFTAFGISVLIVFFFAIIYRLYLYVKNAGEISSIEEDDFMFGTLIYGILAVILLSLCLFVYSITETKDEIRFKEYMNRFIETP